MRQPLCLFGLWHWEHFPVAPDQWQRLAAINADAVTGHATTNPGKHRESITFHEVVLTHIGVLLGALSGKREAHISLQLLDLTHY